MRRPIIAIALGSLTLLAATVCSAEIITATSPFAVTVQREPINTADPIFRAFLNRGDSKFTFIIPEKFSTGGDPAHGRLQLKTLEGDSFITLVFLESDSLASEGTGPEAYRKLVTERYLGGKIVREYSRPVVSGKGTAFEVNWKSPAGFAQTTRVIYFPTSAGVIELTITSGLKNATAAKAAFNGLLGTFDASVNGKLEVKHLGGAN